MKKAPKFLRVLPLISAWISTMTVAQQPREWPNNIESLLLEYLSNIPGKTLLHLEVHCAEHHCVAVFDRTTDGTSDLGHDELSPIVGKGWNVVAMGTGGGVDRATGTRKGFVHFYNDEHDTELPPSRDPPPPRFIPLSGLGGFHASFRSEH